jgi:hypothetical protein
MPYEYVREPTFAEHADRLNDRNRRLTRGVTLAHHLHQKREPPDVEESGKLSPRPLARLSQGE